MFLFFVFRLFFFLIFMSVNINAAHLKPFEGKCHLKPKCLKTEIVLRSAQQEAAATIQHLLAHGRC